MKNTFITKTLPCYTIIVCVAGLLSISATEKEDDPVLMKATLFTHTNDDDKDHDTGIFVEVKTADDQSMIATATDRDDSSDDSKQYKDGSDHQFDLDLGDALGMKKSTCKGFKAKIWQETHNGRGHDTWKFNARVTLVFSDRTNIIASVENVTLKSNGTNEKPSVSFAAP